MRTMNIFDLHLKQRGLLTRKVKHCHKLTFKLTINDKPDLISQAFYATIVVCSSVGRALD